MCVLYINAPKSLMIEFCGDMVAQDDGADYRSHEIMIAIVPIIRFYEDLITTRAQPPRNAPDTSSRRIMCDSRNRM